MLRSFCSTVNGKLPAVFARSAILARRARRRDVRRAHHGSANTTTVGISVSAPLPRTRCVTGSNVPSLPRLDADACSTPSAKSWNVCGSARKSTRQPRVPVDARYQPLMCDANFIAALSSESALRLHFGRDSSRRTFRLPSLARRACTSRHKQLPRRLSCLASRVNASTSDFRRPVVGLRWEDRPCIVRVPLKSRSSSQDTAERSAAC